MCYDKPYQHKRQAYLSKRVEWKRAVVPNVPAKPDIKNTPADKLNECDDSRAKNALYPQRRFPRDYFVY